MLSWSVGNEVCAGFPSALDEKPQLDCDRADLPLPLQTFHRLLRGVFLLVGTPSAKWTLHKLCTLVQSKLSICELSYLMLRMKTSKGEGGF